MKPEISRIIVVRRETDGRFARAKRGIIFADRGKRGRSEKSNRGKTDRGNRGPSCEQQQTRVPRRRNKREREREACTYASGFANSCPVSHLATFSEQEIYTCVYIYIFRRAKKFLLSTIVTCHRIRIACLLLVFKTVVVSRTWNDFTRELTYKAFIYWYFARIFARIKKENSIF